MINHELDIPTLRLLLWLMLKRHGGKATFTRAELEEMATDGTIIVRDDKDNIFITTFAAPLIPDGKAKKT